MSRARPLPSRYLVVSDLHLADVEEHGDGWRYFKSARYLPDRDFAALLERWAAAPPVRGERVPWTLLLNGDTFDFDLVTALPSPSPWPLRRRERLAGLDPTPERSAWKLRRILDDHPVFLDALVGWLAGGNRLVLVAGNHDGELHFPEVRAVLAEALRERARERGLELPAEPFRFEPWFFYVPGEIYAEHGQQYDSYSAFDHVLDPTVVRRGRRELALSLGNLANRLLMSRMGYFNPHATDYILALHRYVAHWLRYYAFTRRSLVWSWFRGSLLTLGDVLSMRRRLREPPPGYAERLEEQRRRAGLDPGTFRALLALPHRPISHRLFRIAREFWLDRLLLFSLLAAATVVLIPLPVPTWLKLVLPLAVYPLLFTLYERLARGETVFHAEQHVVETARRLGELLHVPVVTFGHTHLPRLLPVGPGIAFADTGAWAPITAEVEGPLLPGLRNSLVVDFTGGAPLLHFDCLTGPEARLGGDA